MVATNIQQDSWEKTKVGGNALHSVSTQLHFVFAELFSVTCSDQLRVYFVLITFQHTNNVCIVWFKFGFSYRLCMGHGMGILFIKGIGNYGIMQRHLKQSSCSHLQLSGTIFAKPSAYVGSCPA